MRQWCFRYQRRSPWANSGFVVTLEPQDFGEGEDPLAGVALQEQIEKDAYEAAGGNFAVPALRLGDFLRGEISSDLPDCSYPRPLVVTDFSRFLPPYIHAALRSGLQELVRRIPEFDHESAVVTAPESRSSSPVRIDRDAVTFESTGFRGLYPLGEGVDRRWYPISALDGMKAAEAWSLRSQLRKSVMSDSTGTTGSKRKILKRWKLSPQLESDYREDLFASFPMRLFRESGLDQSSPAVPLQVEHTGNHGTLWSSMTADQA